MTPSIGLYIGSPVWFATSMALNPAWLPSLSVAVTSPRQGKINLPELSGIVGYGLMPTLMTSLIGKEITVTLSFVLIILPNNVFVSIVLVDIPVDPTWATTDWSVYNSGSWIVTDWNGVWNCVDSEIVCAETWDVVKMNTAKTMSDIFINFWINYPAFYEHLL